MRKMENDTSCKATITFDLRQQRIRIYKDTLHQMGDPEYIQLLVNMKDGAFAIRKVEKDEKPNFRVNWKYLSKGTNSYEIKCYYFILKLIEQLNLGWNTDYSYRVSGVVYPEKGLSMYYPLLESQAILDGEPDGE